MENTNSVRLGWLVLPSLWLCHTVAVAQQDVYGNAQTNNFQSQVNNLQTQQSGPTSSGSGQLGAPYMGTSALGDSSAHAVYAPTGAPLEQWGPVEIYPHLVYFFTYGKGVQASPGVNSTTFINTVAPGVFFKLGGHWSLDVTPSLSYYSNPVFHNTTDQDVRLNGITTNDDWILSLSQSYIDTTQPLVETGTQVDQVAYATAFNASWQMASKASLQLGLNQNFRFVQGLNDLHEWSTADWYNYQFEPQLGAALGATCGYDEMSLGSDMPFEQALGRVVFQPGTKLSLTLIGGLEDRQFIKPYTPPLVGPVFQAFALYRVFDGTLLTLTASRTVIPSLEANQVNTITSVTADFHQKIVGRMFFEVIGSYSSEPFDSIVAGPLPPFYFGAPTRTSLATTRVDTSATAQFRLSTTIQTRLKASVFYMYHQHQSTQTDFNYSGNQVGLELNFQY